MSRRQKVNTNEKEKKRKVEAKDTALNCKLN